jgi:hypothetical protein
MALLYQHLVENERVLYVEANWGLGNRLRTYSVAYELAHRLNRKMVIVIEDNWDKRIYDAHPNDLFSEPDIRVIKKAALMGVVYHQLIYNVPNDCSIEKSLADFTALDRHTNLLIYCCGLRVPGLEVGNIFYKQIKPSNTVMTRISPILMQFVGKKVVGVHIRQGSIGDYYYGNYYGKWDNAENKPPTLCCWKDATKNVSACPDAATPLDGFIEAMKRETNVDLFFICSDRPGCMLALEQEFPKKLVYNNMSVNYEIDTVSAFCDWYCLSQCDKLILASNLSSFSGEAIKVKNTEHVFV